MVHNPLSPESRAEAMAYVRLMPAPGDSYLKTALNHFGIVELPAGAVLNIGGGFSGRLEKDFLALNPGGFMISIDPYLGSLYNLETVISGEGWPYEDTLTPHDTVQRIKAIGQELPFCDNAFDVVMSHAALPVYLPESDEQYVAFFSEVLRVLKPAGRAYMAPMTERVRDTSDNILALLGLSKTVDYSVGVCGYGNEYTPHHKEPWYSLSLYKH